MAQRRRGQLNQKLSRLRPRLWDFIDYNFLLGLAKLVLEASHFKTHMNVTERTGSHCAAFIDMFHVQLGASIAGRRYLAIFCAVYCLQRKVPSFWELLFV